MDEKKDFFEDLPFNLESIDAEVLQEHVLEAKGFDDKVEKYKNKAECNKSNNDLSSKMEYAINNQLSSKKNAELIQGLKPEQMEVIELTVKGLTVAQISKQLNIAPSTIRSYKKNDKYNKMLEKVQKEYSAALKNKVMSYVPEALEEIVDMIRDPNVPYREKLGACKTILEYSDIKKNDNNINEMNINNTVAQIIINPTPPKK